MLFYTEDLVQGKRQRIKEISNQQVSADKYKTIALYKVQVKMKQFNMQAHML